MRTLLLSLMVLLPACSVSEDMIANKELYCSGVYKGIRAVGRVATQVTTGLAVPDVCETIDEIVEEDTEKKSSETSTP
jgi:hypothetical protein